MATATIPGQATSTFTRTDLAIFRDLDASSLFQRSGRPRKWSHEDWFGYFWREANGAWQQKAKFDDGNKLINFLNKAFSKDADWPNRKTDLTDALKNNPPMRTKGPFQALFHDTEYCDMLETLLNIGFEFYPWPGSDGLNIASYMRLIDKQVGFEIRWRGESSRDFQTVRTQGYSRQALIPKLRTDYNLDKNWHPFSKSSVNEKLWYRIASTDNDWYTVVSVTPDWQVALGFPKIAQTPSLQILKPGQAVDSMMKVRNPSLIGEVEFEDGSKELRMITRTKIALILIDTMYFDTRERQGGADAFPEHGVAIVPGKNVMGMVEFIRVHHGALDDDGFTAVLDLARCKQVFQVSGQGSELLAAVATAEAEQRFRPILLSAWNDAYHTKAIHMRWAAAGWSRLSEPSKTRSIKTITMQGARIY